MGVRTDLHNQAMSFDGSMLTNNLVAFRGNYARMLRQGQNDDYYHYFGTDGYALTE